MDETELSASGGDMLLGQLTTLWGISENPSLENSCDASSLNFVDGLTPFDNAPNFFGGLSTI